MDDEMTSGEERDVIPEVLRPTEAEEGPGGSARQPRQAAVRAKAQIDKYRKSPCLFSDMN